MIHTLNTLILILSLATLTSCQVGNGSQPIQSVQVSSLDSVKAERPRTDFLLFSQNGHYKMLHPEEQIAEYVRRIFQSSNGDIWLGTNGEGVARYNFKTLDYFNHLNTQAGNQITFILEDRNKHVWMSTDNGIARFDGQKFSHYSMKDGLPSNYVWSLMEDNQGVIWAGTVDGLCKFENGRFVSFLLPKSPVEFPQSRFSPILVRSMLQDKDGAYWFGLDGGGVCKFDGKEFSYITTADGLNDNQIVCLIQDKNGTVWMGSMFGGLHKFKNGKITTFDKQSGDIRNNEVWNVFEDSKGRIWFSSEGYGVYRINGNKIENFSDVDGLMVRAVQSIFEDSMGNIWVGGGGGLYLMIEEGKFINVKKGGPWGGC